MFIVVYRDIKDIPTAKQYILTRYRRTNERSFGKLIFLGNSGEKSLLTCDGFAKLMPSPIYDEQFNSTNKYIEFYNTSDLGIVARPGEFVESAKNNRQIFTNLVNNSTFINLVSMAIFDDNSCYKTQKPLKSPQERFPELAICCRDDNFKLLAEAIFKRFSVRVSENGRTTNGITIYDTSLQYTFTHQKEGGIFSD